MTFQLYRCTDCGKVSVSLGYLHGHIEKHRGVFGIQFPWQWGDFDALMERTEIIEVEEWSKVPAESENISNGGELDTGVF